MLHLHHTGFRFTGELDPTGGGMAAVYQAMTLDDARNEQILVDATDALARGRHCLILTQRTAHLEALATTLRDRGHDASPCAEV